MVSITENPSQETVSNTEQLIEVLTGVIGGVEQQVVDARNLHTYLESKQDFSTWVKNRLTKYKFVENEDFVRFHKKMEANNATLIEYHLTLDTAKELSMVENNEKGRAARRYFIRCEKMAFESIKNQFLLEPQTRVKRTTKDKRTALHEAIALLMTKSKYLHFKDCYKIIHQRFNVDHLDEIPEKQLPEAVQYVHGLMCGKSHDPYFENHANVVAHHMLWVSAWWRCYGESLRVLNPTMAGKIHDHFADGAFSASLTLGSERRKEIDARIQQDLPYMLKTHDLIDFFRHR